MKNFGFFSIIFLAPRSSEKGSGKQEKTRREVL
jgi:hypothetical protein